MLDYQFTKKTNLITDTMNLLSHLSHFDFMDDSEVEATYLAVTKAIIQSDTDTIWEIVDSIQEDEELIHSDMYEDTDRATYYATLLDLRKLASGEF